MAYAQSRLQNVLHFGLLVGFMVGRMVGCRFENDSSTVIEPTDNSQTDEQEDSDTSKETGPDLDCSRCQGPVCIVSFSGHILYSDGTPVVGEKVAKICLPNCILINTDENGFFSQQMPFSTGCRAYDFDKDQTIDFDNLPLLDDQWVHYVAAYTPTQEQVSDEGPDDFDLYMGEHYRYPTPVESVQYTPSGGAAVNIAGIEFELAPGEIGDESHDIRVLKFPLDEWVPPFVGNPLLEESIEELDVLYYITPYWTEIVGTEGVVYKITPPEGWPEGENGKVYILGDFIWGGLDITEDTWAPIGQLYEWCDAKWENGKLVTDPIPRLSWIGLKREGL